MFSEAATQLCHCSVTLKLPQTAPKHTGSVPAEPYPLLQKCGYRIILPRRGMVFERPSPATQMWEPFCGPRYRRAARLGPGLWFANPCSGPKRVTLKRVSRTVNLGALGHCKCRRILSSGSRGEWTRRAGEHPSSAHSPSAAAVSTQRNSSASSAFNYLQSQSEHDPEQRINISTCVALRKQRGLCRKRSDEVGNGHSECRTVTFPSQDKHLLALAVVLSQVTDHL